jgi:hypothetical protein
VAIIPIDKSNQLKSQGFMKADKAKEMLDSAMQSVIQTTQELRTTLQVLLALLKKFFF